VLSINTWGGGGGVEGGLWQERKKEGRTGLSRERRVAARALESISSAKDSGQKEKVQKSEGVLLSQQD